jgi:uncharacterized protein YyaL (SSP411 family)
MALRVHAGRSCVALLVLLTIGLVPATQAETLPAGREASAWLQLALETQAVTRARLRVLGDATSCAAARFVSYRRSSGAPGRVDEWSVASQLWADAALLPTGPWAPHRASVPFPAPVASPLFSPDSALGAAAWNAPETACDIVKGFVFLDRLWDDQTGGYDPRADLTATAVERAVRYADDNSLTGLALLAAAARAPTPAVRHRYLDAAHRTAAFLLQSGLWDDTFGGGFWWNTNWGDTAEGKPAQSNALAAQFFAQLYQATGADVYRQWALRTLHWLDHTLYEPAWQLYRWSVHYADPTGRTGGPVISDRYFNYDQSLAIEAQLLAASLDGDPQHLERARAIGRAVPPTFWNQARGGYNLEAGIEQVYTAYAAWTSLGHLALYALDGDPRWLDLARANAAALDAVLRQPERGYAVRYYRCVDRTAPGCESGEATWVTDPTLDTAAQAWIQHLQTAIALGCACPRPASAKP